MSFYLRLSHWICFNPKSNRSLGMIWPVNYISSITHNWIMFAELPGSNKTRLTSMSNMHRVVTKASLWGMVRLSASSSSKVILFLDNIYRVCLLCEIDTFENFFHIVKDTPFTFYPTNMTLTIHFGVGTRGGSFLLLLFM